MNVFILDERFTYSTGEEKVVPSYKVSILGLRKLKEKGISYTTSSKEADKWAFKELYDGSPLMIKKKHISATKIKAEDIDEIENEEEEEKIDDKIRFKKDLVEMGKIKDTNSVATEGLSKEASNSELEEKDEEKDR